MRWIITADRPVYLQLVEQLEQAIVAGEAAAGSKLASVRELATEAGVNPNTMQKAMQELENEGLIITQRTAGRTVTEDENMIQTARKQLAQDEIMRFLEKMHSFGFTTQELIRFLQTEGEKNDDTTM
ncbi:MAG: GntR family transcriptional regulator [Ruthenibacterium sp.]